MIRTLKIGVLLTVLVTAALGAGFGTGAVLPAASFGLLATVIQVGAGRAMRGASALSFAEFLKRYGIGMGLRVTGVAVLLVAIVARPELFLPLPTALGFLGVLIPLLFFEARLAQ
ncbi:MAG: hypothetical protein ABR602_01345 [Gemmatimonadales bacterium]